jgi:cobalamin biosynthesis Mg chelatase CobN
MVWKDYASAVIAAQKPVSTQNNDNTVIKDAGSNQSNAGNQIQQAQGETTAKTTTQEAIKQGEIMSVTGEAASKSFTWVWATLGLAAVGGGLWWMFGRKAR